MSKRCNHCGFTANPDDAHYCGKCGQNIDANGHRWLLYDSSDYSTYKWRDNKVISNARLTRLQNYERTVNSSWIYSKWPTYKVKLKKVWNYTFIGIAIAVCIAFFFAWGWWIASPSKSLSVIKVNGKYGIGYSEKDLKVPANYDTIFPTDPKGDYWVIKDLAHNKVGTAYVTDKKQNVIAPVFDLLNWGTGKYAMVTKGHDTVYLLKEGVAINDKPLRYVETIPGINNPTLFKVQGSNYAYSLLDKETNVIADSLSYIGVSEADHVVVTSKKDSKNNLIYSDIYDFEGKKLNKDELYEVGDFYEGLAWARTRPEDYSSSKFSVIDKEGNVKFTTTPVYTKPIGFSEGIGFYKQNTSQYWVALDTSFNRLFQIEATRVYPYTMGLAPVTRGTKPSNQKVGFIDKKGEVVIPFLYSFKRNVHEFDSEGRMPVYRNGVEGYIDTKGNFELKQ